MPTMPGKITKGHILATIEKWVNTGVDTGDYSRPDEAKSKLGDVSTYPTLASALGALSPPLVFSSPQQQHVLNHWLDPKDGWWPRHQPVGPILRRGFYEACDLVLRKKGLLDIHWICQAQDFDIFLTWNGRQVNMLISTPPPPNGDTLPRPVSETILVVRRALTLGATEAGVGFDPKTGILTERLHIKEPKK